ncbi:PREDICTED: uncharacterized protein At4g18490 isoform X2 [Ipomoea nil]|uniref:uncharacterized protein At4g18490 isoform X2 n=1 Tax=Ipomoea nil TaxID=35883 RepID=UPI000901A78F|nr:PREDICTED: uncharacterized protein At4g18490 isoform X2 [Ipomoea nil]
MTETQKGASSSAKAKEKSPLLDLDIGNDFLNSWKSISIGDESMDFDFGPISKNKKKTFNFDKEDMDFNLDSNFSKISSFKIDMSDLDISSPSKKNGKTKEKSNEESSGASNKGKADSFNFNFDFKEVDGLSFESSPRAKEQPKKILEIEGSSETSAHQGSGLHLSEDVGEIDGGTPKKNSEPEMAITSTADSLVDSGLTPHTIDTNCSSKCTANNNDASISATVNHKDELMQTRIFPMRKTSTNTQHTDFPTEKGTSPESVAEEAIQDVSPHSSGRESSQDAGSDLLKEVGSLGAKLSSSDVEKDLELIAGLDSNDNKTMPERFLVQLSNASQESSKFENDKNLLVSNIEGNNTHPECNIARAKKDEHLKKVNDEIQEPISRLLKAPLSSETAVQNLTQGKGDCGTIRSKFFKPSIETAAHKQKKSLTQAKHFGTSPPSHGDEGMAQNGKGDENGKEVVSLPGSRSPKSSILQAGSQDNCKGFSTDISHVRPLSTGEQSKSMPHNNGNPRVLRSAFPSMARKTSGGDKKIYPIKAGRQTLDFPSLKLSKNVGSSPCVSQSLLPKDGKALGNLEQNTSLKSIAQSMVTHPITTSASTQKPNITPLKRKTTETAAEMIITSPFKRPLESPSEHRISDTQDFYSKDWTNCNTRVEYNSSQTSAHDIPQPVNKKELGVLPTTVDDDNVKKAEAYSKDLDDICNKLRKMHEEAKELFVQSIVNNNKLLLLNHPIYEQKIHVVKNFAAGLMKRETQT